MYTFNTPHILTLFSNWSALCTSLMKPVRHFECTMPKLSGTFSALCTSLLKPMSALCAHFWNLSGTLVALCTSLLNPVRHLPCFFLVLFPSERSLLQNHTKWMWPDSQEQAVQAAKQALQADTPTMKISRLS